MSIEFIDGKKVSEVIEQDELTVLWFSVPDCPPCKFIEPFMEEASKSFNMVRFYRVEVEKFPDVAGKFNVTNAPTLLFFRRGRELKRLDAITGKKEIFDAIRKLIE